MELLLTQIVNGIAIGAAYALLVTGLNLMLLIKGIFQWAFAHIVVISMYVIYLVMRWSGDNVVMGLALGLPAAIGIGVGLSILTEPMFRPMAARGLYMEAFIAAVGLGIILTNVMSQTIGWGAPIMFPVVLTEWAPIQVGPVSFARAKILTVISSILIVVGLFYFLYRRQSGRAFRATAQDPRKARLLGIPINRTNLLSFALAGLVGGASAILLSMALGYANPALPNLLAVKGLSLVLMAGPGNLIGGLIASFVLGVAETMVITYVPGDWMNAIIFTGILIVILAKPSGLFGAKV